MKFPPQIYIISFVIFLHCCEKDAINYEKEDLLTDLNKMKLDMCYAAPEYLNSPHFFQVLGNILNRHISPQDYNEYEWCKKIIDIFRDPNYKT